MSLGRRKTFRVYLGLESRGTRPTQRRDWLDSSEDGGSGAGLPESEGRWNGVWGPAFSIWGQFVWGSLSMRTRQLESGVSAGDRHVLQKHRRQQDQSSSLQRLEKEARQHSADLMLAPSPRWWCLTALRILRGASWLSDPRWQLKASMSKELTTCRVSKSVSSFTCLE